jgi:hypothetical protein
MHAGAVRAAPLVAAPRPHACRAGLTNALRCMQGWLHQHLHKGIRILTLHLLRLASAAVERLQNLPEPGHSTALLSARLTSPLPSRTPSTANLPQIVEHAGDGDSEGQGTSGGSQWGDSEPEDLSLCNVADVGAAGALADDVQPPGSRGIFRHVSQKHRRLKVCRGAAPCAMHTGPQADSATWSTDALVSLLQDTCEEVRRACSCGVCVQCARCRVRQHCMA